MRTAPRGDFSARARATLPAPLHDGPARDTAADHGAYRESADPYGETTTISVRHDSMWKRPIPISSVRDLGSTLRRRRGVLGLSQKRLGESADVEPSAISRLEREADDRTPVGAVIRLATALGLELNLCAHGSRSISPPKMNELGLSSRTTMALAKEKLESIAQLDSANLMLARPEFRCGSELYEIICALTRHGLTPPGGRGVPSRRDHEILRRRIIDGLTLEELAKEHDLHTERIRQILSLFGVSGVPPAASLRRMWKKARTTASNAQLKPR